MKKEILNWLKTKKNYVYYKSDIDDFGTFNERLSTMLLYGRVHFTNLEASNCYIVENSHDNISYTLEKPTHYRNNFENFNVARNEYIYDKVKMNEAQKNFTTSDSIRNKAIVLTLLKELKHSYASLNKFLNNSTAFTYKDVFFDANSKNINQFIDDAQDELINKSFSMDDFKSDYIDKIKSENHGLKEIGIFYPFKLDHDIFLNKHYLFEINHLKFQKNENIQNFLEMVHKFYKGYGLNSNYSKELFSLEEFFTHPGFTYNKTFAYFDPIKNYEKYIKEYHLLKVNILKNKVDFQEFIHELFDFFNITQVSVVKFQHENLISSISTNRSENRLFSVRDLVKKQIKKIETGELIANDLVNWYHPILHSFDKQPKEFNFTKNTKIENIPSFQGFPEEVKQYAQFILDDFLSVINKDKTSMLQYIYNHHKTKANNIIKKYKLDAANKKIIYKIILNLIQFYNDGNTEKLSKPYNQTINKTHTVNQHKSIDDIIDFEFQQNFIAQHHRQFNKYMPYQLQSEGNTTKYLMTY